MQTDPNAAGNAAIDPGAQGGALSDADIAAAVEAGGLGSIFNEQSNGNSPQGGDELKNKPAGDDPAKQRYEYWQGQADHFRTEAEQYRPLVDEYKRMQPVIDYLKQNPDMLEKLESSRSKPANTIQPPSPPSKPANYDPYSADPGSESFRYRVAREEYLEQLANYNLAKQELIEREFQRRAEEEQMTRVQRERLGTLSQTLVTQYGFTPETARDFIETMNSKDSMSLDNMVNLYKVIKHGTRRVADAKRNIPANQLPPPPPVGGGSGGGQVTDDDAFWGGIGTFGKRPVG